MKQAGKEELTNQLEADERSLVAFKERFEVLEERLEAHGQHGVDQTNFRSFCGSQYLDNADDLIDRQAPAKPAPPPGAKDQAPAPPPPKLARALPTAIVKKRRKVVMPAP